MTLGGGNRCVISLAWRETHRNMGTDVLTKVLVENFSPCLEDWNYFVCAFPGGVLVFGITNSVGMPCLA